MAQLPHLLSLWLVSKENSPNQKIVEIFPIVIDKDVNLLGLDVLSEFPSEIVTEKGKTIFRFVEQIEPVVRAAERILLAPASVNLLKISVNNLEETSENVLIDNLDSVQNFDTPRALYNKNFEKMVIINPCEHPIRIEKGQRVANIYNCRDQKVSEELPTASSTSILREFLSREDFEKKVDSKIEHIQDICERKKWREMLLRREKAFDVRNKKFGLFPHAKVTLIKDPKKYEKALNRKPQKRRVYDPNTWSRIEPELNELEHEHKLIRESPTARGPPCNIVAVKRANSDRLRLCCDFTTNQDIDTNFHPMPSFEEILMHLKSFECISGIDIFGHFWNFELDEPSKELTNFYAKDRVMQWNRVAFGLKSASAWTTKLVSSYILNQTFMKSLPSSACVNLFIDDAVIISNASQHCEAVEKVISAFQENGLQIKFSKCNFMKKEMKFLGHVLRAPGEILPDKSAVEAIRKMKIPESTKELRMFLGVLNHKRQFIHPKKLVSSQAILTKILRGSQPNKNIKIKLSNEEIKACEELKEAVCELTALRIPDFNDDKGFEIFSDASELGIGAVIKQTKDHMPLEFASHSFGARGKTYDNLDREAAALMFSIFKFRRYIVNSRVPVSVYTDSRVLAHLRTATAPKLIRWRALLQQLPIKFFHKSGTSAEFKIPDGLSRLIDKRQKPVYNQESDTQFLPDILNPAAEIVIANIKDKLLEKNSWLQEFAMTLFLHIGKGHPSAQQLKIMYPKLPSESTIREYLAFCPSCAAYEKVRNHHQIDAKMPNSHHRNHTWFIDIVFPKIGKHAKKIMALGAIDEATRYCFLEKLTSRSASNIISALKKIFSYVGSPKILRGDREKAFLSADVENFCSNLGTKIDPLTRKSPFLNKIERRFDELKKIARKNPNFDLKDIQNQLNLLPFSKMPKGMNFLNPVQLYSRASQSEIEKYCKLRDEDSLSRSIAQRVARKNNIKRFERKFEIGDCVKSNKLDGKGLHVGKIVDMQGSKMLKVKLFGKGDRYIFVHASDAKKVNLNENSIEILNSKL